ncbi:hypothetical protein B1R32_1375 [Abditibacterium utsteinense]|uniref:Uncharacterized protein n=1 Tax=Abditibacterium utsteinense TaxID=1960156 RepID=A0A2S8SNP9_9BACT|nr:hypothetical protein [Abditibacterium utsteinense]PQV62422.1 hypothetical protein B1R32_1375 [Abditibacterium utsteinense]
MNDYEFLADEFQIIWPFGEQLSKSLFPFLTEAFDYAPRNAVIKEATKEPDGRIVIAYATLLPARFPEQRPLRRYFYAVPLDYLDDDSCGISQWAETASICAAEPKRKPPTESLCLSFGQKEEIRAFFNRVKKEKRGQSR